MYYANARNMISIIWNIYLHSIKNKMTYRDINIVLLNLLFRTW